MRLIKFLGFFALAFLALASDDSWAQPNGTPAPYNDCSGSIIAGGTAQQVLGTNYNRRYLFIQNPSATVSGVSAESLFTNNDVVAAADGKSDELANLSAKSYGFPNYVPTGPVSVEAATSNHKFVCKWN